MAELVLKGLKYDFVDGNDGLCNLANVASNISVEQAEAEYTVRIERYRLLADSGGPGMFRAAWPSNASGVSSPAGATI